LLFSILRSTLKPAEKPPPIQPNPYYGLTPFWFGHVSEPNEPNYGRTPFRSASPFLRGEWAFFRRLFGRHKDGQHLAGRYGFDRHELLPLRCRIGSVVEYLGKYIGKDLGVRLAADKGVRRVSYGRGVAIARGALTLVCPGNDNCRDKQKLLAGFFGFGPEDYDRGFKRMLGPHWGWHVLKAAKAIQLPQYRSGVHAFLDGVITREDIEEGVIPIPLVNLAPFWVRSSTMNDSWHAAYNLICQAHFFRNRTAPPPDLRRVGDPTEPQTAGRSPHP